MSTSTLRAIPVRTPRHHWSCVIPRLIWMGLGPCAMMVLAVLRVEYPQLDALTLHAAFGLTIGGILVVRWIAWIMGDRRDSFGCRIGPGGVLVFTGMLLFFATLLWALVHLILAQSSI